MNVIKELFIFNRAESIALIVLLALLCVGAGVRFYQKSSESLPVELYFTVPVQPRATSSEAAGVPGGSADRRPSPNKLRINLNTAPSDSLTLLPGIGSVIASRIVEYRESAGRFESIDELTRVSGIGPRKLAGIREFLFVD